jgi:hypothetical protein
MPMKNSNDTIWIFFERYDHLFISFVFITLSFYGEGKERVVMVIGGAYRPSVL